MCFCNLGFVENDIFTVIEDFQSIRSIQRTSHVGSIIAQLSLIQNALSRCSAVKLNCSGNATSAWHSIHDFRAVFAAGCSICFYDGRCFSVDDSGNSRLQGFFDIMVESSLTDAMLQDDLEEEREAFVSYMRDNSQRDHVGCQEPFWITLEVALKTLIVDDVTIQVALVVILEMQVACAIQVRKLTWKRHLWKIPVTWKWNVRCMLSQRLSQRNV